jgi:hypothetical protein
MNRKNKPALYAVFLFSLFWGALSLAEAQYMHYNVDWQINTPVGNDFANKTSGWGARFEAGYCIHPQLSVGGFVTYHTNNKYIKRQTIRINETSSVTSDQQHSVFQLPFGATVKYTYANTSLFEPYAGLYTGTCFSEVASYMNIFKAYERKWGFYVAPEIGLNIFFTSGKKAGLRIAAYSSYATNKSEVLSYAVKGLNNWGARIGIVFMNR